MNARLQPKSKSLLTVLTAGSAITLLAGTCTPANAFPFDQPAPPRPSATTHHSTHHGTNARTKLASRTEKKADPKPTVDLVSRAKGTLQAIISLDKQQLTLYSGNEAIAHSRISTGMRGRSTPTGIFSVIQKDRWHRSNLYDDAPMFFMQRITWSGVAMHEGYVPNYPASHGCIRLPSAFAKQIWGLNSMGMRVIIAHGEVKPVDIAHPALFTPKPAPAVASVTQSSSLEAAQKAWQIAFLDGKTGTDAMPVTDVPAIELPPVPNARPLKPGPVSVFISRKTGKLYVRKGFEPLLETPVTIDRPDEALGTHVFTAISADKDSAHWTVVTVTPGTSAAAALDRITIPQDVRDRIATMMSAGASLIISDKPMSGETGRGTDFIVTGL